MTASLAWTLPGKVSQQHGETFQKKGLWSYIIAIFCFQIYYHRTHVFANILWQLYSTNHWGTKIGQSINVLPVPWQSCPSDPTISKPKCCPYEFCKCPKPSKLYTSLFNIRVDWRKVGRSWHSHLQWIQRLCLDGVFIQFRKLSWRRSNKLKQVMWNKSHVWTSNGKVNRETETLLNQSCWHKSFGSLAQLYIASQKTNVKHLKSNNFTKEYQLIRCPTA